MLPTFSQQIDRRAMLYAGGLGTCGLSLRQLLHAEEQTSKKHREKSVILILPWGGPSQHDTLDLKPEAPAEIRSPFKPIETTVPGLRISEHLPKLASRAKDFSVVRSVTHKLGTHNPATHYVLTGHKPTNTKELAPASREDYPSLGAVLGRLKPTQKTIPPYIVEPCPLVDQAIFSGGQNAGFWGPSHDPLILAKDPSLANFTIDGLTLDAQITPQRFAERKNLLEQLNEKEPSPFFHKACDLLVGTETRAAFALHKEPERVRQRYGMTRFGQSVLLARRLIEAGVRLVLVADTQVGTNSRWDTHEANRYPLIEKQLKETDLALSALLDDLRERGLLQDTLVLWMGEFGRTPKMNNAGGRDHWPHVYSFLIAGGGVQTGKVVGSSDKIGAHPATQPVAPEDVLATIYRLMGIPLSTTIYDTQGRPHLLCQGTPIADLC
jgi:hypothetical protein